MSTATDNAIAAVIAGAPQPNIRITHLPPQPDPLDRIAAALEAQNAILGRLADAVEDIAAIVVNAENKLTELIDGANALANLASWPEGDHDQSKPGFDPNGLMGKVRP